VQGEAEALNSTGALVAESAGPQDALALYRQALQLSRQVYSPLDEARALEGAARCTARTGDRVAALTDLREAVAIYQRIGPPKQGRPRRIWSRWKTKSGTDTPLSNRCQEPRHGPILG
jgi:hypothetical protein